MKYIINLIMYNNNYNIYCVAFIIVSFLLIKGPVIGQNFQAGCAKVDITPLTPQHLKGYGARVSTGVYDHIFHRIVTLDDGNNRFILVSSDLCSISPSEYERVKELVANKFNVSGNQFWWSVTHTHSAPEVGPPGMSKVFLGDRYKHDYDTVYTNFVIDNLLSGIEVALSQMKPANLGVGWGYSQANINRRGRDVSGRTRLGMNPDGPVDRRIGIINITDKNTGKPIVNIANYAIHGTVMSGSNLLISGDAPGVVSEYVEKRTGVPLLFINGAAGNLAPIYSVYPNPEAGHLQEFRVLLGDKILEALEQIVGYELVELKFGSLNLRTPRKENLEWAEDLEAYTQKTETGKDLVVMPIPFLKLSEKVVIWAAPLELFCELSNEIRDKSPFPYTFYFGYTNGSLGYLLTEEEFDLGGYEPTVSPFTRDAGELLINAVSGYLQGELIRE